MDINNYTIEMGGKHVYKIDRPGKRSELLLSDKDLTLTDTVKLAPEGAVRHLGWFTIKYDASTLTDTEREEINKNAKC